MQLKKFPLPDTRAFNSFFLDYIEGKETLKPFYNRFPRIENFKEQIRDKQQVFPAETRKTLVEVLKKQYSEIKISDSVKTSIELLSDNHTFTITTGHQLNIFTGPLYFIYKIVSVINTCRELKSKYPSYNFVPVYWMASEDHDYDEIKYFRLYGKKYVWNTQQQGAVGRFNPDGLAKMVEEIPGDNSIFKTAYSKYKTLSGAVRHYVNELFKDEGLVVVDADDATLKAQVNHIVEDDILHAVSKQHVGKATSDLEALGYKTQVYCRDINFFYLDSGLRSRIEKSGDRYKVIDTNISFSEEEIRREIKEHPERFSPNVILRPLYQEVILPNLAYIGGPAEVIYWLQLKQVFEKYQVPFPVLMPRNFAMVMTHDLSRKLEKTGLELKDIFEEKNYLFNHWVLKYSPRNLTVGSERTEILKIFEDLKSRAELVDKSLSPFVGAEGKRVMNSLEKIERKLLRSEKRLHSDKLRQIEFVKDTLFPNGSLQERTDSFLNFYQQDPSFIKTLLKTLEPFDFRFNVLMI